ncbi:hypothetical protein TeGR_g3672 [Tetraparma gracilis]|uniref:Uncharacterized protein n=1 Tax=Tetraparma gracilis TaxID=2962635 RepID=A0ABQ6MBM0_9STRA|nr:hypothetical protein TeGR_g3672 [Tetraparma gracilis]
MKELNLACNMVQGLPSTLGKLNKLNVLKANGNKIKEIPIEIGKLKLLKVVHLNENEIIGVPEEIAHCPRLEVLRLQNNNIGHLPSAISELPIKEIDVSLNNGLTMIPRPMRGNTGIIMWILGLHHENTKQVLQVEQCNMDMLALFKGSEDDIEATKKDIVTFANQRNDLAIERANLHVYLTLKAASKKCTIS